MFNVVSKPQEDALKNFDEALGWLEGKLAKHSQPYLAGTSQPTVADLAVVALVSTYEAAGFSVASVPGVAAWLARCKENIKGYKELNEPGAAKFGEVFKSKLQATS